jgi:hypothetical protein
MNRIWYYKEISWEIIPINTYPVSGTNTKGSNNNLRNIAKV